MSVQPQAFFLRVGDGQRFCLFHPPHGAMPRGLVVYIHPFAEEMNKARRMAALQSRALARAGYAVLQIDLLGCGDSSGDFGDATWQVWVNDVVQGSVWLRARCGAAGAANAPLWLWGLRAGCLLAAEAAPHLGEACNFLLWQPPPSGRLLLQQFLRLKVAGDMLSGRAKGVMDQLRQTLNSGSPVEVAGYVLGVELASGLELAELTPPVCMGEVRHLVWLEVSPREDAGVSPVSAKTLAHWQQSGYKVDSCFVSGPAFWQTTEIEDAPGLIDATLAALAVVSA